MNRRTLLFVAVLSVTCWLASGEMSGTDAAPPVQGGAGQSAVAAQPGVVKFSPKMSASALAGRPDSDIVELSDGRRVRLGDVRRLRAASARLRAPVSRLPKGLQVKPSATGGTRIADSADLAAALKRPDGDTVVLPSGQRVTVGMIRFLQPDIEKKTGRPITAAPAHADRSSPTVKVTATSDWKSILKKPDGTVLEAPNGARITVGDLKKGLAARKSGASLAPKRK